jgi:hypothetical protein
MNLNASLNIGDHTISSESDIKILKIRLDTALRWKPHFRAVEAQTSHQVNALKTITGSTWGASFETKYKVYCAAVRPAITYECST